MSAAQLIKRFGEPLTVFRDKNAEKTIKGVRVPDKYEQFVIIASVQPLRPDEIVEEARGSERAAFGIKVYSTEELRSVNVGGGLKADIVEYHGQNFEIKGVDKWIGNKRNLGHYVSTAMRINKEGA